MMTKTKYFSSYQSPNIVIVPTSSENIPPLKRTKINNDIITNTQTCKKSDTVTGENHIGIMSMPKNVATDMDLSNKNVPSVDSAHKDYQILEEKDMGQINECNVKTENTVTSKSQIILSDSLKTSKKYVKELSMVNYVNKSEGKLTEPESLKSSIDKDSEKFTITSSILKEPLQKSKQCKLKYNTNLTENNKMENKTSSNSKKFNKSEKYSKHSSLKENGNRQQLKFNRIKMEKTNVHIRDMDKKNNPQFKSFDFEDIKKYNSNIKLKSSPIKSKICKQIKKKIDKCTIKKEKARKIIKIVINVTYNNSHEKKDAKVMRESEHCKNPDLSFLDDFDVDEVVESLLSCKNMKENINERIEVQNDTDNTLIKSSSIYTEDKIMKEHKNKPKNKLKEIKHKVQHIPRDDDVEKHDKVSHVYNRSLEKVINKIKPNDKKKYKKVIKILEPNTNNVIETKVNLMESEFFDTKRFKNQLMVGSSSVHTKESSKDLSSSDSNNVMNAVNTQKDNINHECLVNEYKTNELLSQNLEIKMSDLLMEKFSINTVPHYGKFSKIFKCTNMVTGNIYAIKMLNGCDPYKGKRKKKMMLSVQDEIPKENLCCVFLINSFILDHHWCFMTHYYSINLLQVMQNKGKSFHIDEIRNLSMQLVLALLVVRNKNIVHSDIKPSHILLNSELKELKLCGFDEAYYYYNSNYSPANIGSVNYRAPEIILGYSNDFSIDIWSMALVMYEMVTCSMLFLGETNNEILYKQISTFGNIPCSMIMQSRFSKDHFVGTNFVRNGNCYKKKDSRNDFGNDGCLQKIIMDTYEKHWGKVNTKDEIFKLNSLCHLLKKMFILNPKHRLPVEYVYANNFFSTK